MNIANRYATTKAQRALRSHNKKIFQLQRRPGSNFSTVDPIVPKNCGDDRYDVYLSTRKGEPCWIGKNVFITAQGAFDYAIDLLNGIGAIRPVSIWVDPAPPWKDPTVSRNYGEVSIGLNVITSGGTIAIIGPGGGFQGESHNAGYIDDITIFANASFDLEFVGVELRDILFDDTGAIKIKMWHCDVDGFIHTAASKASNGYVELQLELFDTFWSYIELTDDTSSAASTYDGDLVSTWMDRCFTLGDITVNVIKDAFFSHSWIDFINVGGMEEVTFQDILGTGRTSEGGFRSAIHIRKYYRNVIIDGWWGTGARAENLVVLDLDAGSVTSQDVLKIHNCSMDGDDLSQATPDYLVRNIGATAAPNISVMGCFNGDSTPVGLYAGGAIGKFTNSVFGPNVPDCLDYSGVTGLGNKIWSDCGREAAAAASQSPPLIRSMAGDKRNLPIPQPAFVPPTSGGGSWV